MAKPFLLVRASIGLAALGIEQAAELSERAAAQLVALPSLPVRIVGGAVQSYLHLGQSVTALAQRGDRVLDAIAPPRIEQQPHWAHFDEDDDLGDPGDGPVADFRGLDDDPVYPIGDGE